MVRGYQPATRNRNGWNKGSSFDAFCSRAHASWIGVIACMDGRDAVFSAWLGKTAGTLGAVHGALSRSDWNRFARFVLRCVLLGFRMRNAADDRTGDAMGSSLLLWKYLRRLGFRPSFRVLRQGSCERSRGADGSLSRSPAHLVARRSWSPLGRPCLRAETMSVHKGGRAGDIALILARRTWSAARGGSPTTWSVRDEDGRSDLVPGMTYLNGSCNCAF